MSSGQKPRTLAYFPKMKVRGVSRKRRKYAARQAWKFRNFTRNYGIGAQRLSQRLAHVGAAATSASEALERFKKEMTRFDST